MSQRSRITLSAHGGLDRIRNLLPGSVSGDIVLEVGNLGVTEHSVHTCSGKVISSMYLSFTYRRHQVLVFEQTSYLQSPFM